MSHEQLLERVKAVQIAHHDEIEVPDFFLIEMVVSYFYFKLANIRIRFLKTCMGIVMKQKEV